MGRNPMGVAPARLASGAQMDEPGSDQDWGSGGIEPSLEELMNDPIMHLLLRRDGLTSKAVWRLVGQERDRLGKNGRSCHPQPRTSVRLRRPGHEGRI